MLFLLDVIGDGHILGGVKTGLHMDVSFAKFAAIFLDVSIAFAAFIAATACGVVFLVEGVVAQGFDSHGVSPFLWGVSLLFMSLLYSPRAILSIGIFNFFQRYF